MRTSRRPVATESGSTTTATGPRCTARVQLVSVELAPYEHEAPLIRFPEDAIGIARGLIGVKDREHFLVIHLDGAHRVSSCEVTSVGTATDAPVHCREVLKGAFLANARSIIVAHNHPSGDVAPSKADREVFDRLHEAGELLGIQMLDFLIVSEKDSWASSEHWVTPRRRRVAA